MMTIDNPPILVQPPALSLPALFLRFLRFGCLAFGGPVAQIAMLRQTLVEDERWISPARFKRLFAVLQVLPGPEAHEMCVHLGMIARGRWGGLLAGLGFMLPGFALMMLAGWLYQRLGLAGMSGAGFLLGVQLVVVAIIVRAVEKIGGHVLEDRWLGALALAAFAATLIGVPFWVPLAGAGAAYALAGRPVALAAVGLAVLALAILLTGRSESSAVAAGGSASMLALFVAGLKGGLLTFGGAYTAIPYVRADTVGRGWLEDATFLDGIAIAGMLPAPLVIFATFVGYVAGGPIGAVAVTLGMFLPAFAFSMIFFERLEAVVENPALHRLLGGVAAAAVGIIGATAVQLALSTADRIPALLPALAIFAAALIAAWRLKGAWVTPVLVLAGALAGWAVLG